MSRNAGVFNQKLDNYIPGVIASGFLFSLGRTVLVFLACFRVYSLLDCLRDIVCMLALILL